MVNHNFEPRTPVRLTRYPLIANPIKEVRPLFASPFSFASFSIPFVQRKDYMMLGGLVYFTSFVVSSLDNAMIQLWSRDIGQPRISRLDP